MATPKSAAQQSIVTRPEFRALAKLAQPVPSDPYANPEPWYTIPEAAQRAKMHQKSIYRLIRDGFIPVYGRSNCLRVKMSDVLPRVVYEPREISLTGQVKRKPRAPVFPATRTAPVPVNPSSGIPSDSDAAQRAVAPSPAIPLFGPRK